jgi:SAM-dependent methyltransferase
VVERPCNEVPVTVQDPAYDPRTLEASEGLVRYNEWVLEKVSSGISGRVLEIGAGTGTLSSVIEPLSSEMVLVEPAPNLCALLEERFAGRDKVKVWQGSVEVFVERESSRVTHTFDTVVSFNVLEHIPDDIATLRTAREALRPGGRLVLFVPSLPVLYGTLDARVDHLRRYTKKSLGHAISAAGFDLERLEYFDFLGMIPWFIVGRVLRSRTWGQEPSGRGLERYDRTVIPLCRAVDRVLGPPVGKNLIAVARCPER